MSPSRRRRSSRRRSVPAVVTPLEPRRLMTVAPSTLTQSEAAVAQIPSFVANLADPAADQLIPAGDGSAAHPEYLTDPNVPGTIATIETSKGNIVLALTDQATPVTVANFLSYVDSGAYESTVFHRTVNFDETSTAQASNPDAPEVGGSPEHPGDVIQGGGYTVSGTGLNGITTNAPIENDENDTEALSNVAGTIATANTGAADSVTSQFFLNNSDNSESFDTRYTAFGHVLSGMDVITAVASLPTSAKINATTDGQTAALPDVPIAGLTEAQIAAGAAIGASNLVYVEAVVTQPGNTYTATSSDPTLVTPTVTADGKVNFAFASGGKTGTATITVTGTNAYDGTSASESFLVTVPPASSTATAPITAADSVPAAVTGTATVIHQLDNDTSASLPLDPTSVKVTTAPADGTATVNADGSITYTSTAGFTGNDTFDYTVADSSGAVSAATAVTVHVVPTPTVVNIGAGTKLGSILFTQPDGTRGRFAVANGSAAVTFSPGDTTATAKGGVEVVTGAGATISNVVVTDKAAGFPTVSLATLGKGSVTLGGLSDVDPVAAFLAPTATATGTVNVLGARVFELGSASHATITVGAGDGDTIVRVPTAVDTSFSAGIIQSFTARSWTADDDGAYTVTANAVVQLTVSGAFADKLSVTGDTGYSLFKATVGGPASGAWSVNGAVYNVTVDKPTSGWALASGSVVRKLTVNGDLQSTVSAAEIENMTVTGAMTDATVETSGSFNQKLVQLEHLRVGGAMTDSVVFAAGNVDTISARSMSGSRIYAGVSTTVAQDSGLPAGTTDLQAEATIDSVTLTAGKDTFANSEVAAYTLRQVSLGRVTAANNGTAFGVSAHAPTAGQGLGTLALTLVPGGHLELTGAPLKSAATLSAYLTRHKVSLSDFKITLY